MNKLLIDGVNFGARLKELRKGSGLTQYDIELEMDLRGRTMTRSRYANIEQGRGNLFIVDLILLKDIYGVEYNEFFDGLLEGTGYKIINKT